ncbi:MAG: hypothetical protein ACRD3D_05515 [Terriglobia bacterium]
MGLVIVLGRAIFFAGVRQSGCLAAVADEEIFNHLALGRRDIVETVDNPIEFVFAGRDLGGETVRFLTRVRLGRETIAR